VSTDGQTDPDPLSIDERRLAEEWLREMPALVEQALRDGTPASLIEYHQAGGPAHFSFLDGATSSREAISDAIETHFRNHPKYDLSPFFQLRFNRDALNRIEPRRLSRDEFYGFCFDKASGKLLADNRDRWMSEQGEFAYAFAHPPHGVHLKEARLQSIFDEIDAKIFPESSDFEILDWSGPELGLVSNYFDAGLEWWGAFLFSVSVPSEGRLTIISASTTD
jgi:hypothetical protein